MPQGFWGGMQETTVPGMQSGFDYKQRMAQLEWQKGMKEEEQRLEQERLKIAQEKHDWEMAQTEAKEVAMKKLISSVPKPTGAALTKKTKGGEKVNDPMAELKSMHESEQALARLDPGRYLERNLPPTQEGLLGIQKKKKDIELTNAQIESYEGLTLQRKAQAAKYIADAETKGKELGLSSGENNSVINYIKAKYGYDSLMGWPDDFKFDPAFEEAIRTLYPEKLGLPANDGGENFDYMFD